jgi:hypothetical protein
VQYATVARDIPRRAMRTEISMKRLCRYLFPLVAACLCAQAVADDRADYNQRSGERFIAMFRLADYNRDNVVTVDEAQGIIELQYRYDDIDTDRDGRITMDELTRHLAATYR